MNPMRSVLAAACLACSSPGWAQTIYTWTDEAGTVHYSDVLSSVPQGVKVDTTEGAELAVVQVDKDQGAAEVGQPIERPAPVRVPYRDTHLSAITGEELDEQAWRDRFRAAHAEVRRLEDELAGDRRRLLEPLGAPNYLCGGVSPGAAPAPYRAADQISAMEARATVQPTPGIGVPGAQPAAPPAPPAAARPRRNPGHWGGSGYGYGGCLATPSPEYERLRERIERNAAALERAEEALADLEREASHHGVPRSWRKP